MDLVQSMEWNVGEWGKTNRGPGIREPGIILRGDQPRHWN
jgi:hypothetical protein